LSDGGPAWPLIISNIKEAARSLGLTLQLLEARGPGDFDGAFAAMARERVGALFVVTDPVFIPHRARLVNLAAKNRLPSIFTQRADVEAGGLISYGPNFADMYRRAATYVDKILLAPGLSHREPSGSNRAKIQPAAIHGLTGRSPWVTVG